jgi:hypothetical protein
MMLLASAGGNRVPVIARLVQADEDTVRDVIHRFNEIGLAGLDPQWAGGRPRLLSPDDEDFVGPDGHHPSDQARAALHPLVHSQAARLPAQGPRPGDPDRSRGPALPARPTRRHLPAHQDASWANPIEAHFGPLRQFTLANSNHPNHTVQTRALHAYLRRRNANARHPDVLAAQRRERTRIRTRIRIRSEKGLRWGGRPLQASA